MRKILRKSMLALAVGSLLAFSPTEAASLHPSSTDDVRLAHEQMAKYVDSLAVSMIGEGWQGRKAVSVGASEANAVDFINGVTMGASTLITWSDDGDDWFGKTESSERTVKDKNGNDVREVSVDGSFEGKNATAFTTASTARGRNHRVTNGNISFTADKVKVDGSFSGACDIGNGIRKSLWTMKVSGGCRTIDIVYDVNGLEVTGRYFAVDTDAGKTYEDILEYNSDEPNFVRDIGFVLRQMQ